MYTIEWHDGHGHTGVTVTSEMATVRFLSSLLKREFLEYPDPSMDAWLRVSRGSKLLDENCAPLPIEVDCILVRMAK
jgi:hypothetical protein